MLVLATTESVSSQSQNENILNSQLLRVQKLLLIVLGVGLSLFVLMLEWGWVLTCFIQMGYLKPQVMYLQTVNM